MQDFRHLKVWQKAHAFVLAVYPATAEFPQHELFGLRTQMRRTAFLIPTKIAEGCGRESQDEFARCLYAAQGAGSEAEYLLILCRDLGYLDDSRYSELSDSVVEVRKMMTGLIHTLNQ
jgi:four helix bundle protein